MNLPKIDIEDHDHFRCVLHQSPVPRLALAHQLLGQVSLGDVAYANDVAVAAVETGLAHRDFDG